VSVDDSDQVPWYLLHQRGHSHLDALRHAGSTHPDLRFLSLDGQQFTTAQALRQSLATAEGLTRLGVSRGDRVVIILPSRPEAVWSWLGSNLAGAIDAPLAPDVDGVMLAYYLQDLEPRAVIGTSDTLQRVGRSRHPPELAVVVGDWDGTPVAGAEVQHVAFDDLTAPGDDVPLPQPGDEDTCTIIYTSGTTGPPKGVMLSHGYWAELSRAHMRDVAFNPGTVAYCAQPLHHVDARSILIDCLVSSSVLVLSSRFSASRFWDEVEGCDADLFFYIGTMLHLIHKQPDHQSKRVTRRRVGLGSAAPASIYESFQTRFNVKLVEGYGMTESAYITGQDTASATAGNVGTPAEAVEALVVDDDGEPVSAGEVGELVIRPRRRHVIMQGYWRKPEATLEAFRDLWFHTGDLMRLRPHGSLEYVGRKKDSIRRRGENVSAWEVEQVAMLHDGVSEAAAFGVPSPVGDEDVAMLLVRAPGQELDLASLRASMARDLSRHAVPRYLEVVSELPKTPSERIAKAQVRDRGLSAAAFDAEASPSS